VDNPLVVVHGKTGTATAQLVYTEYVMEKQGEQAKGITQGKEYSTFAKVDGHSRYKTRMIRSGTALPEGWKE
jgi:hypothetical protein